MRKDVIIVIATYNEADNIEKLLDQLTQYKVIIVDDSSPDGTGRLAGHYMNVKVVTRRRRKGIASAYYLGFKKALDQRPKYIIQMDAGLTHDPKDIKFMLGLIKFFNSINLVAGARFIQDYESKGYRTFISKCAAYLMGLLLKRNIPDATSGFRCWRASALEKVLKQIGPDFKSKGFAFQLETLYQAAKVTDKYHILFTPIKYKLTNSSFKLKMLLEALWIYIRLLLGSFY